MSRRSPIVSVSLPDVKSRLLEAPARACVFVLSFNRGSLGIFSYEVGYCVVYWRNKEGKSELDACMRIA